MKYIYKFTNKVNGKVYIGQTNDLSKRYNGHKSESYNKKASGYFLPFHCAIREYGIENFEYKCLEKIPDEKGQKYVDERERFYINFYDSLKDANGYNVSQGGQGYSPKKKTFEETLFLSKKFTPDEIKDIQKCLLDNKEYDEILKRYLQLSSSFLSNINCGLNFRNPQLHYPLKPTPCQKGHFTKEQIFEIKHRIKNGEIYKTIAQDFGIKSMGFLSGINSGRYYYDKTEQYPLYIKGCRKSENECWVQGIIKDICTSQLKLTEIAKKWNKSYSTVTNINSGRAHKQPNHKYPLR